MKVDVIWLVVVYLAIMLAIAFWALNEFKRRIEKLEQANKLRERKTNDV